MGSTCSSCAMGSQDSSPHIVDVDLFISKNAEQHHTDRFDLVKRKEDSRLVIRRGQKFSVLVRFDHVFNPEKYELQLTFKTGASPKAGDETFVTVPVLAEQRNEKRTTWQAWAVTWIAMKELHLRVVTSPDAVVARWELEFQVLRISNSENRKPPLSSFPVNGKFIYILFNPWCYEDSVFYKDERKLNEYVLNEVGKIWRGVQSSFRGMVWSFGQFEPGILDAAMDILDKSPRLLHSQRANPIFVCREASAMVNSNDGDNGVVVGNWSGDYEDAIAPSVWQGSTLILQQWRTTGQPVRYGQCWVFSGILTTVMRALGIACRPISNFESGHDTDATVTYDIFVDTEGNEVKDMNKDSAWNFHVWNEVWMARPDLTPGYGGWQIVDSTPQERSENVYQTGPASIVAVRNGEVDLNYDTAFVFAEVNADKIVWLYRGSDEPLEVLRMDTDAIGNFLSTKHPGTPRRSNEDRRDMTLKYKPAERTDEERMTMLTALKKGRSPARNIYYSSEVRDITITIELEKVPMIGSDFSLLLKLKNGSSDTRTLEGIFRVNSMLYTGVLHQLIKRQLVSFKIMPDEEKTFNVELSRAEYLPKLIDQASMMATAMLKVVETNQMFHADHHFRARLPEIILQTMDPVRVNKTTKVKATFKNPLPLQLTGGKIILEGPGLEKTLQLPVGNVDPGAEAEIVLEVVPKRNGELTLLASYCSKELQDVNGAINVQVE